MALESNDLSCFGKILDESWNLKRTLASGISSEEIDIIILSSFYPFLLLFFSISNIYLRYIRQKFHLAQTEIQILLIQFFLSNTGVTRSANRILSEQKKNITEDAKNENKTVRILLPLLPKVFLLLLHFLLLFHMFYQFPHWKSPMLEYALSSSG